MRRRAHEAVPKAGGRKVKSLRRRIFAFFLPDMLKYKQEARYIFNK